MRRLAILPIALLTLVVVLVLALAGCMVGSPDALRVQADLLDTHTAAAFQLTITAQQGQALESTISAKRTQGAAEYEIEVIKARAEGTRNALQSELIANQATQAGQHAAGTSTAQSALSTAVWPLTAVPPTMTAGALERESQAAARFDEWRLVAAPLEALVPVVLWYVSVILLLLGGVILFLKALPGTIAKLTAIKPTEHGMPMVTSQTRNGLVVHNQDQNVGAGAVLNENGVTPTGMVDDLPTQERTSARNALVRLVKAMPTDRRDRAAAQRLILTQPATQQLARPAKIEVIESGGDVDGWVSEVERKFLTDGGGE